MTIGSDPHARGGITPAAGGRSAPRRLDGLAATVEALLSRNGRLWLIVAVLATGALGLALTLLRWAPTPTPTVSVPWPLLAAMFGIAEVCVVHVHLRKDANSFSLSEVPLIIGLAFVAPPLVVSAQLAGAGLALVLHRRQAPRKLAFNLAHFAIETIVAVAVYHAVRDGQSASSPRGWTAALVATGLAAIIGAVLVVGAVMLLEGRLLLRELGRAIGLGMATTLTNASLALVAVTLLISDARSTVFLAAPLAICYAVYASYVTQRREHERTEFLYESAHILERSSDAVRGVTTLLERACAMFRAERIEVATDSLDGQDTGVALRVSREAGPEVGRVDVARLRELRALLNSQPAGLLVRTGERDTGVIDDGSGQPVLVDSMVCALRGDNGLEGVMIARHRIGDVGAFDGDDLRLLGALASHVGSALEKERLERRLKQQAFHDGLTHLANRVLFVDRIDHALTRRVSPARVAVLFIDLDDFKLVNDSLGHAAGDDLLIVVAERLRAALRPFDTVARLGGDEFGVLLEDVVDETHVTGTAERIQSVLRTPVSVRGRDLRVRASIGVVLSDGATVDAAELLRSADVAMYTAKARGKGRHAVFQPAMQTAFTEQHELRADLDGAVERGELYIEYQPIVTLETGQVSGVEALVRWRHPERGRIPPAEFIPLAEETGLIGPIGDWVMERACTQVADWQRRLPLTEPLVLSVNVASWQLREPSTPKRIAEIVEQTGLNPRTLVVEITESVVLDDMEAVVPALSRVRSLGVRIALDDFGTGYSSLSYLRLLPIDVVKIDKSFIAGIATGTGDRALTLAIVRLLGTLDLETVAEGIEADEQLAYVRAMGCDRGQGYLFSRPLGETAVEELLVAEATARAGKAHLRVIGASG